MDHDEFVSAIEHHARMQQARVAMAFVQAIERGEITLEVAADAPRSYIIEYVASNGWRIAVFNDCGEWDYIEWIKNADGALLRFDAMPEELQNYRPPDEVEESAYHWSSVEERGR